MKSILKALLICILGFVSGTALAESAHRQIGVTISCTCEDEAGQAYVASVKSQLSDDHHFRQMNLQEGAEKGAILVNIISMPVESQDGKPHAMLSVVYSHNGSLIHQFIETCPHLTVEECAMKMVRDLRTVED